VPGRSFDITRPGDRGLVAAPDWLDHEWRSSDSRENETSDDAAGVPWWQFPCPRRGTSSTGQTRSPRAVRSFRAPMTGEDSRTAVARHPESAGNRR